MASPAEIANDMSAHADYWAGRDGGIARVCRDAAGVLRSLMAGEKISAPAYNFLHHELLDRAQFEEDQDLCVKGYPDFYRAAICLERLHRGAA